MELFLSSGFFNKNDFMQSFPKNFNISVVSKLDNGMYLINMRGDNYQVNMPEGTKIGEYKAEIEQGANDEKPKIKLTLINDNIKENNLNDFKMILKNNENVAVRILKALKSNIFIVDIKGEKLRVKIEDLPMQTSFRAKVIKENDDLIKLEPLLNQDEIIKNSTSYKENLLKFDKDVILKILKSSMKFDISSIDSVNIKKVVQDSGNFFENKLLNNVEVSSDNKYSAIKVDDLNLKDSIQKIQVLNTLLENTVFTYLSFNQDGIKDGQMFIKKQNEGFSVHLKVEFSEIGDTYIKIISNKSLIDVVVSSEKDISDKLNSINIPGLNIHWKKIKQADLKEFDLNQIIKEKFSGFEIIV